MCEDRLGSEKNSEPCQTFAIKLSNKNSSLTIIEKSSIIDVLNKPVVKLSKFFPTNLFTMKG